MFVFTDSEKECDNAASIVEKRENVVTDGNKSSKIQKTHPIKIVDKPGENLKTAEKTLYVHCKIEDNQGREESQSNFQNQRLDKTFDHSNAKESSGTHQNKSETIDSAALPIHKRTIGGCKPFPLDIDDTVPNHITFQDTGKNHRDPPQSKDGQRHVHHAIEKPLNSRQRLSPEKKLRKCQDWQDKHQELHQHHRHHSHRQRKSSYPRIGTQSATTSPSKPTSPKQVANHTRHHSLHDDYLASGKSAARRQPHCQHPRGLYVELY